MIYLGVCITILTTYLGYCFSKKLTKRKKFFIDFFNFNQKLKREMSFSKKTLLSIIENENSSDFIVLLKELVEEKEVNRPQYLNKDEYDLFINYASFVGKSDLTSQINYFNTINESIKVVENKSKSDEERLKPLYLKLGFFIGLAITVILL